MAIYAVRESELSSGALGDNGKAIGVFQLQNTPASVAMNPVLAARAWYQLALRSIEYCSSNSEDERLTLITAGSCDHGRSIARRREQATRDVLAKVLRAREGRLATVSAAVTQTE
jgi:hypothetical protein